MSSGSRLAEDLHLHSFVVTSDSKQVITDINKGGHGRYGAIISEILLQATHFQCNFNFECRAVNVEAHSLGKYSLSTSAATCYTNGF
jgi:hypothetical protein